jgi:citrate lyase subunit beta/citryl-CoA lyase
MRRLRSILYTPGHRPERIARADHAGADAVCLVLEDSVPRDRRPEARQIVAEALPGLGRAERPALVKVNALGPDGLESDLAAIVRSGLAAVVVPKLQTPDDVHEVDRLLTEAEGAAGLPGGAVEIVPMIETPRAVVGAFELLAASPRITAAACAAAVNGDLAGSLGLRATADGLERLYVMSKVLVDARAAGIELPLDGVWTGIGDLAGLEREAERARSLGYRGKLAIHPEQIGPIHRIFTPSAREVEHGRRVVDAFHAALHRGDAAIVVDGQMIDYAMVDTARRVIELAEDLEAAPS